MYLMPVNYTLKMVKILNFVLCTFYHKNNKFWKTIRCLERAWGWRCNGMFHEKGITGRTCAFPGREEEDIALCWGLTAEGKESRLRTVWLELPGAVGQLGMWKWRSESSKDILLEHGSHWPTPLLLTRRREHAALSRASSKNCECGDEAAKG